MQWTIGQRDTAGLSRCRSRAGVSLGRHDDALDASTAETANVHWDSGSLWPHFGTAIAPQ